MGFNPAFLNKQRSRKYRNPEGIIQLQIIHYLKGIGAVVGKTKTMGIKRGNSYCFDIYTMRGKADLECFHRGIMYAIEVKSPGNSIKKDSDQDNYREVFHYPPHRIFIEADSLDDVMAVVK